jgi:L-malate glycosyltransferase
MTKHQCLVFVWDNFGPSHLDRAIAVHSSFRDEMRLSFVQLFHESDTYGWHLPDDERVPIVSVSSRRSHPISSRALLSAFRLWRILFSFPRGHYFLHGFQRADIFLAALLMRFRGCRVYTMNDSKYDDHPRRLTKEIFKALLKLPYHGALTASLRSAEYEAFHGISSGNCVFGYDTVSLDRIRKQAGLPPAPQGEIFHARHFTSIARLVPEKNLAMLLSAYKLYRAQVAVPRPLCLCGSGPLEHELRLQATDLGIAEHVAFLGWLQDDEIGNTLGKSLALLLPSIQETFGIAVIEAQAMGLPVILSDKCGARDSLVRSGVNGFVIEPDNPRGMAYFMGLLSDDETLWRRMCSEATATAPMGDAHYFAEGVRALVGAS